MIYDAGSFIVGGDELLVFIDEGHYLLFKGLKPETVKDLQTCDVQWQSMKRVPA